MGWGHNLLLFAVLLQCDANSNRGHMGAVDTQPYPVKIKAGFPEGG